jgi:hypothetical protein
MGRKAACRYIGAQTDQVIEHHLLSSLLEQALRMKHGELMYPVQILGLAAPSQRFGIDGNDVVLVGFGILYHTVQRLTPPPKAPFSKAVLTRPKPNQRCIFQRELTDAVDDRGSGENGKSFRAKQKLSEKEPDGA